MLNKIFIGITTVIAIILANSFSFQSFESHNFSVKQFQGKQDTIKKDSVLVDSLSVEEGKYNFKLYKKPAHASYYANKFQGRRTASGQRYDKNKLTAAHRKLRFGTKVRVTNERNGKWVIVTINDRGPFVRGRDIDLSRKAFMAIAPGKWGGELRVKIEIAIPK